MIPPLRVMRLPGADPDVALPAYATEEAAGMDLRANLPPGQRQGGLTLAPGERALVPLGLAMAVAPGWEGQVRPRSGRALRDGLTVANAPGTIDADYRGPVGVILVNLGGAPVHVTHGERIAQLVLAPAPQAAVEEVAALDATARENRGFGSTGAD